MSTSSTAHLALEDRRIQLLSTVGLGILRYGLVFLLLLYGSFKFFAFEAQAIQPLVASNPFLAWLYPMFGLQGTAMLFGVFELAAGLLIALRPWSPRLSGFASLVAGVMFLVTLSFLFTTPGALSPAHPANGFLLKDILLLGAALTTAAEALHMANERTA